MTAGDLANWNIAGGHRPPLQSETFQDFKKSRKMS